MKSLKPYMISNKLNISTRKSITMQIYDDFFDKNKKHTHRNFFVHKTWNSFSHNMSEFLVLFDVCIFFFS